MTQPHTTHPLRIGAQLHPQHTTYQSFADAVRRAEDLGVDTIWTWDIFSRSGEIQQETISKDGRSLPQWRY